MYFRDAHALRKVFHLGLAIAGDQNHFSDAVFWLQVLDEGSAVFARGIVEANGGGVFSINENEAFEAAGKLRQGQRLRMHLVAAGDLNGVAFDVGEHALSRAFADVRHGKDIQLLLFGRGDNGAGQRVLGVLLDACGKAQHAGAIKSFGAKNFGELRPPVS